MSSCWGYVEEQYLRLRIIWMAVARQSLVSCTGHMMYSPGAEGGSYAPTSWMPTAIFNLSKLTCPWEYLPCAILSTEGIALLNRPRQSESTPGPQWKTTDPTTCQRTTGTLLPPIPTGLSCERFFVIVWLHLQLLTMRSRDVAKFVHALLRTLPWGLVFSTNYCSRNLSPQSLLGKKHSAQDALLICQHI